MLNNCVMKFYDNFGLIFKGSEDKATNGIENWSLSINPLLADSSSRENRSECPRKTYIAGNYSLWRTFLLLTVWEYLHSFSHSCLRQRGTRM